MLIAQWDAAADLPPRAARVSLVWPNASAPWGSTPATVLEALAAAGQPWTPETPDPGQHLQALAQALRRLGLCGRWRDEAIRVRHPAGPLAIERACARVLGVQTLAVHLIAWDADGRLWLQQRAATKAEDPNRWDTLVGGMVSSAETPLQALARETWEEAGLHLEGLGPLQPVETLHSRRPVDDAGGAGYLDERLLTWQLRLPAGLRPRNQDGEVQAFAAWTAAEVREGIARGDFTLDAARLLLRVLAGPIPGETRTPG